jgi:hypothetical protein
VAFKLNSYEGQAVMSVALAGVGVLAAVGVCFIVFTRFDPSTFFVSYSPKSMFLPVLAVGLLAGLAAGTIGFFVALNSAGQKRNTKSKLAWQGFFLNALVLTVMLSVGIFFFFTRMAIGK